MTSVILFDAGNQRLKWTCLPVSVLTGAAAMAYSALSRDSNYSSGAVDLFDDNNAMVPTETLAAALDDLCNNPSLILSSSVARPAVRNHVSQFCLERWGLKPTFLSPADSALAFGNEYDNPAQLGADRWFAACAARQIVSELHQTDTPRSVICIDAGTAVTVDLMQDGVFRGGAILPGYATIIRALGSNTGQIRIDVPSLVHDNPRHAEQLVSRNTGDAVLSGSMLAVAGGVKYAVENIQSAFDDRAFICVAGGDALIAASALTTPYLHQPDLVLTGLMMEAREKLI